MAKKEIVSKLFKSLDIYFEGVLVPKNKLINAVISFMDKNTSSEGHNVNLVLHTGSILFDIAAIIFSTFFNFFSDETTVDEVLNEIKVGDIVLHNGRRYKFQGKKVIKEQEYYSLQDKDGGSLCLPEAFWKQIAPYHGDSTTLGGQGVRKKKNNVFLQELSNVLEKEIPAINNVSSVFVMSKTTAESLIKGLAVRLNGVKAGISEIAAVSYYTTVDNSYQFGVNPLKCEPNIKFTSKISVAKKLLMQSSDTEKKLFFICGKELVKRYYSELSNFLDRNFCPNYFICENIDSENSADLLQEISDIKLFACTKKFLKPYAEVYEKQKGKGTKLQNDFIQQILNGFNSQIINASIPGVITEQEYKQFRTNLKKFRNVDYESDEKSEYIMQSYSLFNLLNSAVFPVSEYDQIVDKCLNGKVASIKERFLRIEVLYNSLPDYLKGFLQINKDVLKKMQKAFSLETPKQKELNKLLLENEGKRICIIVPKAYYKTVLIEFKPIFSRPNISYSTANSFDNNKIYDLIICLGYIEGTKFNIFSCKSAGCIETLLYDYEKKLYTAKEKKGKKIEKLFDSLSENPLKRSEIFDEFNVEEKEEKEEILIQQELDDFVNEYSFGIFGNITYQKSLSWGSNHIFLSEVVNAVTFDSGEKAFFSKNYKPYIFNKEAEEVLEIESSELSEGDAIIFTKRGSETSDVVEEFLNTLIKENRLSKENVQNVNRSKEWKDKLRKYKRDNKLKSKTLSSMLVQQGTSVQEMTIRQWLNPESRTVGPRDENSIKQIGILIGDKELEVNFRIYFESCQKVRKIRREILAEISKAIISKLSGKKIDEDSIYGSITGKIDALTEILYVESITKYDNQLPITMVNKPLRNNE